ncbi:MAG TPA: PIN domain-containing protein, partial [Steroidobacteraceae bacterium]|nr:PIN domain-containing protein [Steroidobacteraceae bacterium]
EPLWNEPQTAAVSVQVLQELHANLVRKARMKPAQSAERVRHYLAWKVVDNDRSLLRTSFDVQVRWKLNYWDGLIVAAAQTSGAPLLWSEDLADGQRYGDVRVVNPLA